MEIKVKINKNQLKYIMRNFENAQAIFDSVARPVIVEKSERLVGTVQSLTPVGATGLLRRSISYQIRGKGFALSSRIFSSSPYVVPIEEGIQPGRVFPPWRNSALELWVGRRLGISGTIPRLRATFLIARKIFRRGTKAVLMFRTSFEKLKGEIEASLYKAIDDFTRRFE